MNNLDFIRGLINQIDGIDNETIINEGLENPRDNPCWKGYHPVGTKEKNGRTVPNCVPTNEDEGYDEEYDDEGGMAENNLATLRRAVDGLDEIISPGDNLPEWCQEKIAVAKSMLVSVWDYMQGEIDKGSH
jgi:hypothetical protein